MLNIVWDKFNEKLFARHPPSSGNFLSNFVKWCYLSDFSHTSVVNRTCHHHHEHRQNDCGPSWCLPGCISQTETSRNRMSLFVKTPDLKIQKWRKHLLMPNFGKRKLSLVLRMTYKAPIRCRIMTEWITMIKCCVNVWRVKRLNRIVSFCSFVISVKQASFRIIIDWILELKMSHQRKKMGKINWTNRKQQQISKKILWLGCNTPCF